MNRRIEDLKPSASVMYMARAKEMQRNDSSVISLAGGEPDFETPQRITDAAIRSLLAGDTHYCIGPGIPELRSAIANKLRHENNVDASENLILVTPGGKNAIYIAINTIVQPGDEVIILDPSWVSYEPIVLAAGGVPVHVKLDYKDNYRISLDLLEEATSVCTKLLIINYPNNPTGRILHSDEADNLETYLMNHPDVFLLSDEVYEKIIFDENTYISMGARRNVANRVITVNGFSKCVAMTGWRLGYLFTSNREIYSTAYKLYQHSLTCLSEFIQKGAVEAFNCADEIEQMRIRYQIRRDKFVGALNKIPRVQCVLPEGAFYAWVMFDIGMSSETICEYLLEHARVVGMPGLAYRELDNTTMRFSFANSDEELEEATDRIRVAINQI